MKYNINAWLKKSRENEEKRVIIRSPICMTLGGGGAVFSSEGWAMVSFIGNAGKQWHGTLYMMTTSLFFNIALLCLS